MITLQAQARTNSDKPKKLREAGKIPAVLYGGGIKAPIHVFFENLDFKKALSVAGESSAINVTTGEGDHDCIIHDMQRDAVSGNIVHADLLVLEKGKKVEVSVELEFIGVSPAVKSNVGVLEKMLHEIEIEALPKDLPKSLEVDLEMLASIGDHVYVRDNQLPPGVIVKTDGDMVIAPNTEEKKEKVEESAPIH